MDHILAAANNCARRAYMSPGSLEPLAEGNALPDQPGRSGLSIQDMKKQPSSNAPGSLVSQALLAINETKLTANRPVRATSSNSKTGQAAPGGSNTGVKWIQPSGPRRPGEGVENEEQGLISAKAVDGGGAVVLRVTLLAAGFLIGPSGSSVRDIMSASHCDIRSWTEKPGRYAAQRLTGCVERLFLSHANLSLLWVQMKTVPNTCADHAAFLCWKVLKSHASWLVSRSYLPVRPSHHPELGVQANECLETD
eukprot:363357-Chlamydomonas_euryale.AAC.7